MLFDGVKRKMIGGKGKQMRISGEVYEMLEAFAKKAGKSVDQLATEFLEVDIKDMYERARKSGYFKV